MLIVCVITKWMPPKVVNELCSCHKVDIKFIFIINLENVTFVKIVQKVKCAFYGKKTLQYSLKHLKFTPTNLALFIRISPL